MQNRTFKNVPLSLQTKRLELSERSKKKVAVHSIKVRENAIESLKDKILQWKQKAAEKVYAVGGPGYLAAKASFEKLVKLNKSKKHTRARSSSSSSSKKHNKTRKVKTAGKRK